MDLISGSWSPLWLQCFPLMFTWMEYPIPREALRRCLSTLTCNPSNHLTYNFQSIEMKNKSYNYPQLSPIISVIDKIISQNRTTLFGFRPPYYSVYKNKLQVLYSRHKNPQPKENCQTVHHNTLAIWYVKPKPCRYFSIVFDLFSLQ